MRHVYIAAGLGALALSGSAVATAPSDPDNPLLALAAPQDAKPPEAKPEAKKDGTDLRVYWKDGFRMETPDKSFSLRISGRFQNDWAWFDADEGAYSASPIDGLDDGTEMRRVYLGLDGKLYGELDYKIEFEMQKSTNTFADAYLGVKTPIGYARLGHFKQPIGLEELTSDIHLTFMERSLSSSMKTGRDVGLQLSDSFGDERFTWAAGVFRDTNDNGKNQDNFSDDDYAFTGRLTYAPLYAEDGAKVLHLGVAASKRRPSSGNSSFSTKPEANLAPNFLSSGTLTNFDDYTLLGLEAATVLGPISLQGEYMQADINADSTSLGGGDDPTLKGYYVYASYFLTGEHRNYTRSRAAFDRVKPKENFGFKEGGGPGAWEVGLRYTNFDYDDASSSDNTLSDVTLGLNWYWNPFTKIMFNVIQASPEVGTFDEEATIYEMRFQFDF